jgi:hypothetical protein
MSHKTYMEKFPATLKRLMGEGWTFAYSEGLLPFFLSRPELQIGSALHTKSEGRFTAFVDIKGVMHVSSFDRTGTVDRGSLKKQPNVYNTRSQILWDNLDTKYRGWETVACMSCNHNRRCIAPQEEHYLVCAYQEHNRPR